MTDLYFEKIYEDAISPNRKHLTDAGVDVYAWGDYYIKPRSSKIIETGITFKIPNGMVMLVYPKSRSDWLIGAGVIDAGYQGQLFVKIVNYSDSELIIRQGDAVAQVLLLPCVIGEVKQGEHIHAIQTARGVTGGIVTQLTFLGDPNEF